MNKVFYSELFEPFSEISHGFLTRYFKHNPSQGIDAPKICLLKQAHGDHLLEIRQLEQIQGAPRIEADRVLTQHQNVALTIVTADCVPLLFYDPSRHLIGAAHAGWRGTALSIAKKMVDSMVRLFHSEPGDIRVALGPAIGECCYEVDAKVYGAFQDKSGFKKSNRERRWMMSLQTANQRQLAEAGVSRKNIWISPQCTACHPGLFFSYRKEGEKAGRQWSYIALKEKK